MKASSRSATGSWGQGTDRTTHRRLARLLADAATTCYPTDVIVLFYNDASVPFHSGDCNPPTFRTGVRGVRRVEINCRKRLYSVPLSFIGSIFSLLSYCNRNHPPEETGRYRDRGPFFKTFGGRSGRSWVESVDRPQPQTPLSPPGSGESTSTVVASSRVSGSGWLSSHLEPASARNGNRRAKGRRLRGLFEVCSWCVC